MIEVEENLAYYCPKNDVVWWVLEDNLHVSTTGHHKTPANKEWMHLEWGQRYVDEK